MIYLALAEYEAGLCDCGHHRSESMNPAHDPHDPTRTARYVADAPFRCFACTELARAQRHYAKAAGEDEMSGTKWVAELVPQGEQRA